MPFPDSPQHPASAVSHSLQVLPEGFGALHLQIDARIHAFHCEFQNTTSGLPGWFGCGRTVASTP